MKTYGSIRVIVTGATGMVGEGVVHECLLNQNVESVLIINRKPSGISHPKLKEIVHADFFNLSEIESQFQGYNACFFCLGVSSIGLKEAEYTRLTYSLTMNVAQTLSNINNEMIFCYVSGKSTDSSEKGKSMWARVKGKTENDLMKLPFGGVYNFRPGFIKPTPGLNNAHKFYNYINWLYPVGRALWPDGFCTLKEIGLAMIHTVTVGYEKKILEVKDIIALANL